MTQFRTNRAKKRRLGDSELISAFSRNAPYGEAEDREPASPILKRDACEQTELPQSIFSLRYFDKEGDTLNRFLSRSGDLLEAVFAE